MFMIAVLLVGGLTALTVGAELLVRGAARLAALARISPLVIGLTVVAFGTSAPELTVSTIAAFEGKSEIAFGNVVGSNIFNVWFILGISAMIVPLTVRSQLLRFDVPLVIGISILTWFLGMDGKIGLIDGLILASGLIAYTVWSIRASRRESAAIQAEFAEEYGAAADPALGTGSKGVMISLALTAAGLALLVLGSGWFVDGAIQVAKILGMSDLVIGLTIVAVGTSLPEVFTSVVAAIKGERDIAVGNVVGSNLFNLLSVLGLSGIASSLAGFGGIVVPESALRFDVIVMIGAITICMPIFWTRHIISRWEGALLLSCQVIYTTWLIMAEQSHPSLATLQKLVLFGILPVTLLILAADSLRQYLRGSETDNGDFTGDGAKTVAGSE